MEQSAKRAASVHRSWLMASCTLVTALVASTSCAHAEDTSEQPGTAGGGLAEIIVTAQKRTQSAQDTPLAVTAISGDALAAAGIRQVEDLRLADPTLNIGQASGILTTFVRGIGNPVTTAGNEASVPVYIDDVYFVRASAAYFELSNIDRIEVLKGPQGTLFGRNATGGVVSIYTRDPSLDTPSMNMTLGYGNFETVDLNSYVSTPLSDKAAIDFAIAYGNQNEGWGRNLFDGSEAFRKRFVTMRSKFIWEPTDTTKVKIIGYYLKSRDEQGLYSRPYPGTVAGTPNAPAVLGYGPPRPFTVEGFYNINIDADQANRTRGYGGSVRIDQEFGFADLVSITAARRSRERYLTDGDGTPYHWLNYNLNTIDRQFSQELQLHSKSGSRIEYILGAFYLNAKQGYGPTLLEGDQLTINGIQSSVLEGRETIKSYAAFGQATYPLTDSTNITVGLRYTIDKVAGAGRTELTFLPGVADPVKAVTFTDALFDANNACSNLVAATFSGDPSQIVGKCNAPNNAHATTSRRLTYKLSADQHLGRDAMIYGTVSRGYKAGTFNTLPLNSGALKPEIVDVYELGIKSELLGRKLRVNGALFWNDISNPQVLAGTSGFVNLVNAESARTRGAEISVNAAAASNLTLGLAGSYLDAKFRSFADAPFYAPDPSAPGSLIVVPGDASGRRMPYASKWKGNATADYHVDVEGLGRVQLFGQVSYASSFSWEANGQAVEPAHTIVDGSASFTPQSADNLTFRLWAKNLTKVRYNLSEYTQASGYAFGSAPGAPRTYGFEIVAKF